METSMKSQKLSGSRRKFVRNSVAVTVGLPILAWLPRTGETAELPRLDPNDPIAKALKYAHEADSVEPEIRRDANRVCANCRFYPEGQSEWNSCSLFPGKAVKATGWCSDWVARS